MSDFSKVHPFQGLHLGKRLLFLIKARKWPTFLISALIVAALSIPLKRSQVFHSVEITWSISGKTTDSHTIRFQGQQFELAEKGSHTSIHQLRGACRSAPLWSRCGWGFVGQSVRIDGTSIPSSRLKITEAKGMLNIFGIGRRKSASVEIQLNSH